MTTILAKFPQNEDGHEAARRLVDWLQGQHRRFSVAVIHSCEAIHVEMYASCGIGPKWITVAEAVGAFAQATYQGE